MTYDVITVGRVNMDLIAQQIGADFADVRGFDAMVGGSPTNIAIGTTRLGLRSIAFTGVGDDRVGDFVLRYLTDENVVTDFIPHIEGRQTSLALIGVQPPGDFPLSFYREDPADIYLTVDHAKALPLDASKAVLLSGNAFSRGLVVETSGWIADEARRRGLRSFLDLDLRPVEWADQGGYGRAMQAVLPKVEVAIGTEEEFYEALAAEPTQIMARGSGLTNGQVEELARAIDRTLAAGDAPDTLVLKRGPHGASVVTPDGSIDVPGFPVDVVNTVGAGDAFASGLITKRLQGWDWFEAVRFANACGAIEVTRQGCASALPTEAEVVKFINQKSAE